MSFINFATNADLGVPETWIKHPDHYKKLSLHDKTVMLMEQAIIAKYLTMVYGKDTLPLLFADFISQVKHYLRPLQLHVETERPENVNEFVKHGYYEIVKLLDIVHDKINADEIQNILKEDTVEEIPHAGTLSFYRPFLMYAERAYLAEDFIKAQMPAEKTNFTLKEMVSLPSVRVSGRFLDVRYETQFPGYSYNCQRNHKYRQTFGTCSNEFLPFFIGYDFHDCNMNALMGVIASQCCELDTNAIQSASPMWLYYDMYRLVFKWEPTLSKQKNPLALSSDIPYMRKAVVGFLVEAKERYGLKFDDSALLSKLLGTEVQDDDTKNLVKFLQAETPEDVSVEMYRSFKNSCFGMYDELDITKCHRNVDLDRLLVLAKARKLKSSDIHDIIVTQESLASFRKLTSTEAAPSDDGTSDGSADTASDDSTGAGEPDPSALSGDEEPNSPTADPASASAGADGDPTTNTETPDVPPLPNVGSNKGVTLELSPGENTDTVLYRLELEAYLDRIIANPPKTLSNEKLTTLKKVKVYWFNLFSTQTLYDVLNSIIKIPATFKPKKPKE